MSRDTTWAAQNLAAALVSFGFPEGRIIGYSDGDDRVVIDMPGDLYDVVGFTGLDGSEDEPDEGPGWYSDSRSHGFGWMGGDASTLKGAEDMARSLVRDLELMLSR